MRIQAIAALLTLAACTSASAQTTTAVQHPYGLDPYNPRDAAILRDYGGVLVAQTPLSELRKLDPYNPTHAALLRSLGGSIPLWAPWYLPGPLPASATPFATAAGSAPPTVLVFLVDQRQATDAASPAPAGVAPAASSGGAATLLRPESNDGVWIRYAGQTWISGGPAVALADMDFVRVGEYRSFPVFRPRGAGADVIYLPTRQNLVAPYRLKR